MPPAPGMLSTTICWPSASVNLGAMVRVVMSATPPGPKGSTIRIGLFGYDCAAAQSGTSAAMSAMSFFTVASPPSLDCCCTADDKLFAMDLRQLEYFVRVADARSFSQAAEVLSIAQPALSRQVRRLEVELRQALFRRTGRGVTLTAAGKRLL